VATATINGNHLVYDDRGSGDPAILFIHGMACNRSHFAPQMEHFGESHRVVAYDQRGHGESDKPTDVPYDILSLAEDAKALADQLGMTKPIVVGHSLGGTISMALAGLYPDFPGALVILDSSLEVSADVAHELTEVYDGLTEDRYDEMCRTFVRERLFDYGDDETLLKATEEVMASCPREIFLAMGRGFIAYDLAAASDSITAPTLFIGSSRPFVDLNSVRARRPEWFLGRTVGAGHFHQLLVPEQVNAMIDHFLGQIDRGITKAQEGPL
jgi:pimeloyl-ACP methyl ester carboxylesterase